jgi:hypothetical protein
VISFLSIDDVTREALMVSDRVVVDSRVNNEAYVVTSSITRLVDGVLCNVSMICFACMYSQMYTGYC